LLYTTVRAADSCEGDPGDHAREVATSREWSRARPPGQTLAHRDLTPRAEADPLRVVRREILPPRLAPPAPAPLPSLLRAVRGFGGRVAQSTTVRHRDL